MVMKGRPLAKAGYEQELASVKGFIAMQNKADSGGMAATAAADKVKKETGQDGYIFFFLFPPPPPPPPPLPFFFCACVYGCCCCCFGWMVGYFFSVMTSYMLSAHLTIVC